MTSSQLRGAVLEQIVDNGHRPVSAAQIVSAMQSDGLLPPRANGNTIGLHLGDLHEWRYVSHDDCVPRRWFATAEGIRIVTHARATATVGSAA